jgi:hypothetical protein
MRLFFTQLYNIEIFGGWFQQPSKIPMVIRRLMKKGLRQRKKHAEPLLCGHRWQIFIAIYQNFEGRSVGSRECLITSESYRFRKNRCDYRTKSKNIYADLKVWANIFSSQAWAGKGFQSRKNYRPLKESVDATRSQAFSESNLQATKIYAGVKGCVNVVTKITHTTI